MKNIPALIKIAIWFLLASAVVWLWTKRAVARASTGKSCRTIPVPVWSNLSADGGDRCTTIMSE